MEVDVFESLTSRALRGPGSAAARVRGAAADGNPPGDLAILASGNPPEEAANALRSVSPRS